MRNQLQLPASVLIEAFLSRGLSHPHVIQTHAVRCAVVTQPFLQAVGSGGKRSHWGSRAEDGEAGAASLDPGLTPWVSAGQAWPLHEQRMDELDEFEVRGACMAHAAHT